MIGDGLSFLFCSSFVLSSSLFPLPTVFGGSYMGGRQGRRRASVGRRGGGAVISLRLGYSTLKLTDSKQTSFWQNTAEATQLEGLPAEWVGRLTGRIE